MDGLAIGTKVFFIQRGVATPWPGQVSGEPIEREITYPARPATPDGRFPERPERTETVVFQEIVTKRSTNPANGDVKTYTTLSVEPVTPPRFAKPSIVLRSKAVAGFDLDEETGELIDVDTLRDQAVIEMAAHSAEVEASRAAPELAL